MSYFENFGEVESTWSDVLRKSYVNTIFITPEWQGTWWKRFKTDAKLVLEAIMLDSEPIGILPIIVDGDEVTFIGNSDVYDYMDFPIARGYGKEFFSVAWDILVSLDWKTLRLESIPENSPTLELLPAIAKKNGCMVTLDDSDTTPCMNLPDSWDEYLAGLRKKDRHELRRKLRRLESNSEFKQYSVRITEETVSGDMDEFFRLMALSSDDKSDFLTQENKDFFIDLALQFSNSDQYKLFFMEVDGVKVATCICFAYDGTYLLYNSGYDPEKSSLSVGLLNKALTIQEAISHDVKEYNFLRGTERYKYHLGAKDRKVFDLIITR
ncbi:GNAT family N-acetyltransferase [Chloroflexi bacterium]|nr:GNAT family N-acetyltransferase [Chloroflexota bacterium]